MSVVAACCLTAVVAVSGCSSGADDSGGSVSDAGGHAAVQAAAGDIPAADVKSPNSAIPAETSGHFAAAFRRSLIRTAAVSLESQDVRAVIAKVDGLAASTGGMVASEQTSTNKDGEQVSSRIELQVPVDRFDSSFAKVAEFGDLVSKDSSTKDVTAAVADVTSRVASAKDSIAQLRTLFERATKLRDVIALEHELSAREADLESLQAQQRDLTASTEMSTIVVNVSRPDESAAASPHRTGFFGGLKSGWDGLVTFVVATAHGLGVVLPLGTLALVLAVIVRLVVRRVRIRQLPRPSE